LVHDISAETGRPSIDPVVFFNRQLILFFEGVRAERQLLRVVTDRLSLRWYLGYDLTESLPDHSSLTRIRERYGLEVFRRFFEMVVEQCIAAGLVWGQEVFIDATKVAADAAVDSLHPRFAVEAHLACLFSAAEDDSDGGSGSGTAGEGGDQPASLPVARSEEAPGALADRAARRHDWIGRAGRPDRRKRSGTYRRTADFRISTTDPDATPMLCGDGGTRLGYQDHYVVDGGRARIILAALVPPGEVQENQPALNLLWRARFRWKLRPQQVIGDTKYGTVENISALEQQRIRAYFPLSEAGQRAGRFGEQAFIYEADVWMVIAARAVRPCVSWLSAGAPSGASTPRPPPSVAPAGCGASAPPPVVGGASGGISGRHTGTGSAATTPPRPTPKRCANGRSGWNRSSRRPRLGMACVVSACAGWRRSTGRH
jgi:transposase